MIDEGLGRREFLAVAGGLMGSAGPVSAAIRQAAPASGGSPLQVGDRKQLFIDRRFIEASENVALTMNQAQKLGRVLDASNEPWERGQGGYFRVIEDGGKLNRPYFPMGLPDEWDRWLAMMGVGMVRRGNSLFQYYWSSGRMHDSGILRPEYDKDLQPRGGIGALRQRLDGFMSADFAYTGGTLTTPPMVFSGTHLRLNVDSGGMGTAFVEIIDAQGKPIPGFTRAESEEIGGNFLDAPARWKGNADLSTLRGKPISLHVSARGTKLYAFQFPDGPIPREG
jgi:hypothetical protein